MQKKFSILNQIMQMIARHDFEEAVLAGAGRTVVKKYQSLLDISDLLKACYICHYTMWFNRLSHIK